MVSQSMCAASATLPNGWELGSFKASFIRAGDGRLPVNYVVERVTDGRWRRLRHVVARQGDREVMRATMSAHRGEKGFEHQAPAPPTTAPEDCPSGADVLRAMSPRGDVEHVKRWQPLDIRPVTSVGSPDPGREWWARVREPLGAEVSHAGALGYVSDLLILSVTLLPHAVSFSTPGLATASLDHTMWFHRPVRADQWLLFVQDVISMANGRALAMARAYDMAGAHVATVAQEGMVRLSDGPAKLSDS